MSAFLRYASYFAQVARARFSSRPVPAMVTLCVTNRCNLRCAYCYEDYYDRAHPEADTGRMLALLAQMRAMGTRYVSVNGGEALLRADIGQIVAEVKRLGMLCHISTNGLLIDKRLEVLAMADSVAVSLDGDAPSTDCCRGPGVHDKVMRALELLKSRGVGFHTHTVLSAKNPGAVAHMLGLARRMGFTAQFSLLRAADSPDKSLALPDAQARQTLRSLAELKRRGEPVFFSAKAYQWAADWPLPYAVHAARQALPQGVAGPACRIMRASCHIEANGMAYPCVVLVNKTSAKNVFTEGFAAAFAHSAATPCAACSNVCMRDVDQTFQLSPGALVRAGALVGRRVLGRGGAGRLHE